MSITGMLLGVAICVAALAAAFVAFCILGFIVSIFDAISSREDSHERQ